MATKCVLNKSTLTGIADAIRAKGGTTETMKPSQMAAKIGAIPSGGGETYPKPWMNDGNIHFWISVPTSAQNDYQRTFWIVGIFDVLKAGLTRYTIDWGDGASNSFLGSASIQRVSHLYSEPKDYHIVISGVESWDTGNAMMFTSAYNGNGTARDPLSCRMLRQAEFTGLRSINSGNNPVGGSRSLENLVACKIDSVAGSIGASAFQGCHSLITLTIPDTVTTIGASSFRDCYSLTEISIPDSVREISMYAFNEAESVQRIRLPQNNDFTTITGYSFQFANRLEEIEIPASVTTIQANAFNGCSLRFIMRPSIPPVLGNATNSIGAVSLVKGIVVPKGSLNAYKTAQYWSSYASKIVEEE